MDGSKQAPNWQYQADDESVAPYVPHVLEPTSVTSPRSGLGGGISWTASEFIAHHKSSGWYGALIGFTLVAAAVAWFVSDPVSSLYVVFVGVILGVFGARQPRELSYRIDEHGITIGHRQFGFNDFRSFSVMREGAFASIALTPMRRFAPLISVYYDPQDEPKITELLGERLPHEVRKSDPIDRLMWRIRF